MKIMPVEEYVIIKPTDTEKSTESGLLLPEARDTEAVNTGTVIGIGGKVNEQYKDAKVLFKPYGFDEVTFENEKYLVGKAENIMAIIEHA